MMKVKVDKYSDFNFINPDNSEDIKRYDIQKSLILQNLVAAKRTVDRILISIILWDDHTTKLPDSPRILMWPCHNKAEQYGEDDVILLQTEPAGKLLKDFFGRT